MSYIDDVAQRIGRKCAISWNGEDRELLRIYAVLALAKGVKTSSKDIHDAWSAWTATYHPAHRSLIPFEELAGATQRLDHPYRDAVRMVALELAEERRMKGEPTKRKEAADGQ